MLKNSHVPARNAMDDTKGRFHIRRISLPQRNPSIAEYIGLTMKNNIMHNAIPEHSDASLATANGNANITATVTAIQVVITLRLSIAAYSYIARQSNYSIFPAFEMREELAHLLFHLLDCKILTGVFVYLVGELGAVVYHLLHSHVLRELAVLVTVDAEIFVGRAISIRTEDFTCERHSAALTEFHFHCFFLFTHQSDRAIRKYKSADYQCSILSRRL